MEQNNQENGKHVCDSCKGDSMHCHCYGMHHHSLLRILLAFVIVGFVFIAGMKLGELKAELAIYYSSNHQEVNGGMRMEGGAYGMRGSTTTIAIPATPTAPATAPAVAQ